MDIVKQSEASHADVIDGLNDLLQLDHDAVGAYEVAIEKLTNAEHARQIAGFRADHEQHIRALNDVIVALGGTPSNEPHATAPLKLAIQRIAAAGGDDALLRAWRTNELQVMNSYDGYARKANRWPVEAKRVVDANALDEERHYQWVARVLGDWDATGVHLSSKARETGTRARVVARDVRGRAQEAGDGARSGAASGLAGAAERLAELAGAGAGASGIRGRAAEQAGKLAKGLETTAAKLRNSRNGDGTAALDSLGERVAAEVRASPARALGATFIAAFLIGRMLR